MAQLLLELYSEDIPSRMQGAAADALQSMMTAALGELGLTHGKARAYATPQRLTLVIDELAHEVPAQREEKRGPRVGAPDAAIQGFLKGAGLSSLDQCVERDTGKGVFWFALIDKPAQRTADLLPGLIHTIIETFPWPKSMRWGRDARLNWVRRQMGDAIINFSPRAHIIRVDYLRHSQYDSRSTCSRNQLILCFSRAVSV